MDGFLVTLYMILGLLLRIGIPIGVTLLIGWGLRRLDARWRAEAEAEKANINVMLQTAIWQQNPCWETINCSEEKRKTCPAYNQREKPCWEVNRANGNLSKQCQNCIYRKELPIPLENQTIVGGK